MGWESSRRPISPSGEIRWEDTTPSSGPGIGIRALSVKSNTPASYSPTPIYYTGPLFSYSSTRPLYIKTKIRNLDGLTSGMSFSVSTYFGDKITFTSDRTLNPSTGIPPDAEYVYLYSRPSSNISNTTYVEYEANNQFNATSGLGIVDFKLYNIDWEVNGFIVADNGDLQFNPDTHTLGWKFIDSITASSFAWYDCDSSINSRYPVGGYQNSSADSGSSRTQDESFRDTNFISKFIPYQFFNFYFFYNKESGSLNDGIKIYLSDVEPYRNSTDWKSLPGTKIVATMSRGIDDPINADFYGLQGGKYLTIVGDKTESTTTSLLITLLDIRIEGGYHSQNNEQNLVSLPDFTSNITGATYSSLVGYGNTINATQSLKVNQIFSKLGNGTFKSGIWETGVWNSGWRVDTEVKEFDEVDITFRLVSDVRWRLRITGPSDSVSNFAVGDKISIGNIVAIDINEQRKLLKNSFTVLSIEETGIDNRKGYLIIEYDTTFPIRRIEKDSPNHRIKITKNVWLNGAFLNGYFSGIWNNGLIKGYPLITEMYNTNWIDGTFDGGRFNSSLYVTASFVDTRWVNGKVGLTFSSPHKFNVGDVINIDKDLKTLNPQYDGETIVKSVENDYFILTDLDWGENSSNESGLITTKLGTGLIQNFKFYDNNISKVTSAVSMNSDVVFIYNSWIDVNFESDSSVNIGKPQTLINHISKKSYSENNLYGYPTYEVLSSVSRFRDSFSTILRNYNLGTKYTVFNDYIGDSSNFDEFFGPTGSDLQLFYDQGWTFSNAGLKNGLPSNITSITFSRTIGDENYLVEGKELKVEAISTGGVLDISTPNIVVNNREESEIPRNRYTMVEFNLITYSVNNEQYYSKNPPIYDFTFDAPIGPKLIGPVFFEPLIHFNNVNNTIRKMSIFTLGTYSVQVPATYLPVYENVNHLVTPKKKKVDYFYNKRNLGMHFKGSGGYGASQSEYIIDNLKLIEVDMIPFFKYFTEDNINKGVQIPFQGIAPFIDYSNANFQFLDNINIGLDSITVVSSNVPVSGVGPGIGVNVNTGGMFGVESYLKYTEANEITQWDS